LFDAREFEDAQNEFEKAIKAEEESLEGEGAKESMEDIAFYHNNSGLCWYHLARTKTEDAPILENAIDQYNMAIKADDRNPIHYYNRGNVYLNLKHFDKALADYQTAIQKDDMNAKFYHAIGLTYQT